MIKVAKRHFKVFRRYGPWGLGLYVAWKNRRQLRELVSVALEHVRARNAMPRGGLDAKQFGEFLDRLHERQQAMQDEGKDQQA